MYPEKDLLIGINLTGRFTLNNAARILIADNASMYYGYLRYDFFLREEGFCY